MHARAAPRCVVASVLLVATALAGCTGQGADDGTPPSGPGGGTPPAQGPGFDVIDLRLESDGETGPLREDDRVFVRFTLAHPATADKPASHLMSVSINGKVVHADAVRLNPGESQQHAYEVDDVRAITRILVEVRAGGRLASEEAPVEPWPRTREPADVGAISFYVNRWLRNASSGAVDVNVTISPYSEDGVHGLRASILCADRQGNVESDGDVSVALPEVGKNTMRTLVLPNCDHTHTIYGIGFFGTHADGSPLRLHILFVEHDWRPPE